MTDIVRTITSASGRQRLHVLQRADGLFSYQEQRHYINAPAGVEGWTNLSSHASLFESMDSALREAPYHFAWMVDA